MGATNRREAMRLDTVCDMLGENPLAPRALIPMSFQPVAPSLNGTGTS